MPSRPRHLLPVAGTLLVSINVTCGFAPPNNRPSIPAGISFDRSYIMQNNVLQYSRGNESYLQMNQDDNIEEDENEDQYSPQISVDNVRNGNYLEVLALSVTLFFLATTWLTNGQIFSDFSSKYDSLGGKASFYKTLDAEKVLEEDFNRASSVLF